MTRRKSPAASASAVEAAADGAPTPASSTAKRVSPFKPRSTASRSPSTAVMTRMRPSDVVCSIG
ncbi:hypothetical protein QOZ95_004376 [Paenibacillus brasilensis]|uniref:Uncharacterized protein n=1 Tax=Paenibacillus brasilensis TaxID=128574 RepID=A0ABU0L4G6_9BACL|nr:hypothetical protein [Paenibacillus brasilensis]